MRAIVSTYNRKRGFGFATPIDAAGQEDETQPDIFFHVRQLPKLHRFVKRGDTIEFELGRSEKDPRPEAINIQFVSGQTEQIAGAPVEGSTANEYQSR
jgi:cold shock CspA family protein